MSNQPILEHQPIWEVITRLSIKVIDLERRLLALETRQREDDEAWVKSTACKCDG